MLFSNPSPCGKLAQEWRVFGDVSNLKVRMANMIAENALILISLALKWRPKTWVVIEQPKGSRLWNLPKYKSLVKDYSFIFLLTYLGFFGMDLLKGCHLCTNMKELTCLARVANKEAKGTFRARVARKFEKLRRAGKKVKVYYTTGVSKTTGKKTFTGGRDLQSTALYPVRFCNALFQCWLRAYIAVQENARRQDVIVIDGWPVPSVTRLYRLPHICDPVCFVSWAWHPPDDMQGKVSNIELLESWSILRPWDAGGLMSRKQNEPLSTIYLWFYQCVWSHWEVAFCRGLPCQSISLYFTLFHYISHYFTIFHINVI